MRADDDGFVFQLTTSQGGRRVLTGLWTRSLPFNSRPHKEVDLLRRFGLHTRELSTHDLTRRSTCSKNISYICIFSFNSRPHKEVDRCCTRYRILCNLSTHDLTRRSTANIHNYREYLHPLFSIFLQTNLFYMILFLNLGSLDHFATYIFGANLSTFSVHSTSALKN